MRYVKNREFEIAWTEKEAPDTVVGTGNIYFENYVVGKLFFIYNGRAIYALRDAFYRTVVHNEVEYDALFFRASDANNAPYALMRPTSSRPQL